MDINLVQRLVRVSNRELHLELELQLELGLSAELGVRSLKQIGTKQTEISLGFPVGCLCLLPNLRSAKAFKAIKHNWTNKIKRLSLVSLLF